MKKIIIIAIFSAILFSGCSMEKGSNPEKNLILKTTPQIIDCGEGGNVMGGEVYYYTIDKNTGVVYLSYDSHYRHSITVMLNKDGTPVTAEQLGINY